MESATIAANGFRFRVPYGTLLCVSDKPLHGEIKLPGMANQFYRERVDQHLRIGMRAIEILRAGRQPAAAQPQAAQLRGSGVPVKIAPRFARFVWPPPLRGRPYGPTSRVVSWSQRARSRVEKLGISRSALGVSASARPSRSWRTQPRRSDSCRQAAPSAPPR